MAPVDPKNTQRAYLHYTSGGLPHTASFRFADAVSLSDMAAAVNNIGSFMFPLMDSADNILSGEYSAKGSNIRFPLPGITTGNGTAVGGVNNEINRTVSLSITGKGLTGHIACYQFFTILGAAYTDTRLPYATLASNVQDWIDSIRSAEPVNVVDIDLQDISWNGYMNVARNAYWQREQR